MFHFRDEEARIGEVSAWAGWEAVLGLTSGFQSHSPMLPLFMVDPPVSPTLPDVSEQSEQLPEDSQLPLGTPAWLLLSFTCTGFCLMLVVNTLSPSFVKI